MPHRRAGLLATKTQVPRLPPRLVARERLLALSARAASCTLTVIKAAAGFGKTSLAVAWADRIARAGGRIAWVSLDAEDDEPGQFLRYVAEALRRACHDRPFLDLIDELSLIRPLEMVRLLINALAEIDEDIFLFLDDWHALRGAEVAECVAWLLRHAPPRLHLVLTTRAEPELPLVRLRAQNRLLEIDAGALRFDLDETRQFLEQEMTGAVGASEAAALHEKTEGWPVMMRIVATTSQQSGQDLARYVGNLSARNRPIRSHILDMLDGLPDEVAGFLLRVSILESFSARLAQAVTRVAEAEAIVESLVSRQLLLAPLDADGVWFRCHKLLRDFLALRLEAELGNEIGELHRRAYAWYAAEGLWTDAIRHAIAVGDTIAAVQWIEHCAMALLKRGDLLPLLAWQRIVPAELMRRQVKARLAIAWGMALAMRFDEALKLAGEIETDIGATDPASGAAIGCECRTIRAVALALADDIEAALPLAEDCLRANASGPWTGNVAANVVLLGHWKRGAPELCHDVPWISFHGDDGRRNVVATVYRLCLLALLEADQLHQDAAASHLRAALLVASAPAGPHAAAVAQPAALMAQGLYDQGRLDEAIAMLADRLPAINAVCMLECVLRAYVVLIRIALRRGLRARVATLLDQGEQLAISRGWARLQARMWRERARIALIEGRGGEAAACAARLRHLATTDRPADIRAAITADADIAQAMLDAARGDWRRATERLHDVGARAAARQDLRGALECDVAIAVIDARDDGARAALANAAACGQGQVFADALWLAGPDYAARLRQMVAQDGTGAAMELARALLVQLDAAPRGGKPRDDAERALSPRERNIMQLVVDGKSNKDIARALNVTPETIKTHMKRIFDKLHATNRSQAATRAVAAGACVAARAE